jgi:hypothetical protein
VVACLSVIATGSAYPAAGAGSQPAAPHAMAAVASPASHGHWHWSTRHRSLDDVTCPTAHLCLGTLGNHVVFTRNIVAKHPKWTRVTLEPSQQPAVEGYVALTDLSCPTSSFCAAVDDIGNVFTTSDPTGGAKHWRGQDVDDIEFKAISCASAHLCGAVDYYGRPFVSSSPAAGTWHSTVSPSSDYNGLFAVSCVGRSLCVSVLDDSTVDVTTNASGASPTWHAFHVKGSAWEGVSCPTTHKCVAVGSFTGPGRLAVTTHPTSAKSSAWKLVRTKHDDSFDNVSCASAKVCMVTGTKNLYSNNASLSAKSWHQTKQPANSSQVGISCESTTICVAATTVGELYVARR